MDAMQREVRKTVSVVFSDVAGSTAMAALNRELERELEVVLPVRTGVNTGLVLAGDEHAGHAFVGGDTVNVAARLERAAGAGEVLLGEATYRLVADAVRVDPVGPFVPRGRSAPVAAYRLLEVTPGAAGLSRRLDTPLVGRTVELAVLDRALDQAIARRACELLTVAGDPGVGKSRLLRAFAERAGKRALVLYGGCPPHGQATIGQVVGQLLARATALAPAGDRLAADPPAAFREVRRLLEELARTRPVVVVLDDLHSAEPALLDLVEYLHAFAGGAALLVAATRRQLLDRRPRWTAGSTLFLEPLPAADAAELAASLCRPGALDPGTRERIAAWAEGNPLFIEELLRSLERGLGEAGVGAELDRLPPDERTVLELASVVGRLFDWASVAALAPTELRPRVGAVLLALARRNLIRVADRALGEDAFSFRHGLLRDAAYRAIPKRARAVLHVSVAQRLGEAAGGGGFEEDEAVGRHLGLAYRCLAQLAGDAFPRPVPVVAPMQLPHAGTTA